MSSHCKKKKMRQKIYLNINANNEWCNNIYLKDNFLSWSGNEKIDKIKL
jgi:hypothetical protein